MADIPPLTDEICIEILSLHKDRGGEGMCEACDNDWPCQRVRAVARIEQDRALLRQCANLIEGYVYFHRGCDCSSCTLLADLKAAGVGE